MAGAGEDETVFAGQLRRRPLCRLHDAGRFLGAARALTFDVVLRHPEFECIQRIVRVGPGLRGGAGAVLLQPALEVGLGGLHGGCQGSFRRGRFRAQAGELRVLLRRGQQQGGHRHRIGETGIGDLPGLIDVLEEREHRIVVAGGNRIELVVVTACAIERQSEKGGAKGGDAVGDVGDTVLLFDDAALLVLVVQAVEGGGEALRFGRIRQQVARELPGGELVEGKIFVERLDHPVAVSPHGAGPVHLVAVGVSVAGQIEPFQGEPFAIARGGEQAVDHPLVGLRGAVMDKSVDLGGSRRKAGQVKRDPTQEPLAVRFGRGSKTFPLERSTDHRVDRRVGRSGRRGGWRGGQRREGPMGGPRSAFGDPALQE